MFPPPTTPAPSGSDGTRPKGSTLNRIARSALALLAATILVGGLARAASAQNLSDAVISSSPVTSEGQSEIEKFLAGHAGNLTGDAAAIKRAKNALSAPLLNVGMSAAFRLEYAKKLLTIVGPLTTSDKEPVAINALRLAGLAGTKDGLDFTLKGLDDKRAGVRVMAAMSTGVAISTCRASSSKVISGSNATDALTTLGNKLGAESNADVVDAMLLALDDASKVSSEAVPGVRTRALALVLTHTRRVAGLKAGASMDQALSHGVKTLGEALLSTGADKLPDSSVIDAACVAGDVVAAVQARLVATPTEQERVLLGLIAQQCERIVERAAFSLNAKAPPYQLDQAIQENKDADFTAAAQRLYRDLAGKPFNCAPADRYPRP